MICEHINNNISLSVAGRMVYKDECTRCFTTPRDPDGLDLCLKCFNGGCRRFAHSKMHFQMTQHPISLNIKYLYHQKEGQKVTKLAIGKEGGIDFEGDKEVIILLFCHICQKEIPIIDPQIQGVIASIQNMNSALEAGAVAEWEMELKACKHTTELIQLADSPQLASKSLAKCNSCELSSNLWLCLTCGNLGCGRKNYDGSGGNNHAVTHYESAEHPMVVKMGTITTEGNASIHCYACDEEILDPNLTTHLRTFGLQVEGMVKTEKTIGELELAMNLALTLSKSYEAGKQMTMLYGPNFTGINNLGNTCYMASVLQIVLSLREFEDIFGNDPESHLSSCTKWGGECFQCQIRKVCWGIKSGIYSEKRVEEKIMYEGITQEEIDRVDYYQEGIRPAMFKLLVGKGHPEFSTMHMQDALEYLMYFIEYVKKEQQKVHEDNPGKVFEFDLETKLECSSCHGVKRSKTRTNMLQLNIPLPEVYDKDTHIPGEKLWERFQSVEIVQYNCPICKSTQMFQKTQRFLSFPKYLIVGIQRFVFTDWIPKKCPVQLDFAESDFELEILRALPSTPQELAFPEEPEEEVEIEKETNPNFVNEMIGMGLTEKQAKWALIQTGNNSSEVAVGWYFENMGNACFEQPLPVIKVQKGGKQKANISESGIEMLMAMGFSRERCIRGLEECDNNVERAVEYLFSHQAEEELAPMQEEVKIGEADPGPKGVYDMHGYITHLGASTGAGHYIAHIKKGEDWIYFNDNKVAITKMPQLGSAYIYVYQRK